MYVCVCVYMYMHKFSTKPHFLRDILFVKPRRGIQRNIENKEVSANSERH